MPLVERRYAEALVNISVQGGAIDTYRNEFGTVMGIYNTQYDFKFFLLNPEVRVDVKKGVIKKLFGADLKPELVNFLMLLLDKGRIKYLPGIFDEFVKLADKRKNILDMTIISAAPLSEAQVNDIKNKYIGIYDATSAKVRVEIDSTLIGGVKVQVGDKVTDGTIKGRLESLKELLMK